MSHSSPAPQMVDLTTTHTSTVKNIKDLQQMERYLFDNLEKAGYGENEMSTKEGEIVQRLNDVHQLRKDLFNQLSTFYREKQDELNDDRKELADEITQLHMVEKELDRARNNAAAVRNNKNDTLRLVQINQYEAKRYSAYSGVLKVVIFACIAMIVLAVLMRRNIVPFIPQSVFSFAIVAILAVAVVMVILRMNDISRRGDFDFDRYDNPTMDNEYKNKTYGGFEGVLEHDRKTIEGVMRSTEKAIEKGISSVDHVVRTANGHSVVLPLQSSKENFATLDSI